MRRLRKAWLRLQAQSCRVTGNHHTELLAVRGLYEEGAEARVKMPVPWAVVTQKPARISVELPDGRVFGHPAAPVAAEYREVCLSCRKTWMTRVQIGLCGQITDAFAAAPTLTDLGGLVMAAGRRQPVVPAIKKRAHDQT